MEDAPSDLSNRNLCRSVQLGLQAAKALEALPDNADQRHRTRLEHAVKTGRAAQDQLVRQNMRLIMVLVTKLSPRIRGNRIDFDDALQAGAIGFLAGVERYDPERPTRLSTFVAFHIREALLRLHRDAPLLSGAYGGDLYIQIKDYHDYLETALGRKPNYDELADLWNRAIVARYITIEGGRRYAENVSEDELRERALKTVRSRGLWLTPEHVGAILVRNESVVSLNAPVVLNDGGSATIGDQIPVMSEIDGAEIAESDQDHAGALSAAIGAVLQRLQAHDENLPTIIAWHYGLNGVQPMDIAQIAAALNLKQTKVKSLLAVGLEMMASYRELTDIVKSR